MKILKNKQLNAESYSAFSIKSKNKRHLSHLIIVVKSLLFSIVKYMNIIWSINTQLQITLLKLEKLLLLSLNFFIRFKIRICIIKDDEFLQSY